MFFPCAFKKMKGLWDVATYKVDVQNAPYVIINIDSQGQDVLEIKNYFNKHRISGLKYLFVVKNKKLYIVFKLCLILWRLIYRLLWKMHCRCLGWR